jgi:hypothetical protein
MNRFESLFRVGKQRQFGFFDREVVRHAMTIGSGGRFLWAPVSSEEHGSCSGSRKASMKLALEQT